MQLKSKQEGGWEWGPLSELLFCWSLVLIERWDQIQESIRSKNVADPDRLELLLLQHSYSSHCNKITIMLTRYIQSCHEYDMQNSSSCWKYYQLAVNIREWLVNEARIVPYTSKRHMFCHLHVLQVAESWPSMLHLQHSLVIPTVWHMQFNIDFKEPILSLWQGFAIFLLFYSLLNCGLPTTVLSSHVCSVHCC